jgi:hypothetical protein
MAVGFGAKTAEDAALLGEALRELEAQAASQEWLTNVLVQLRAD